MNVAQYVVDFVLDPGSGRYRQILCEDILDKKPDQVFLNIAWEAYQFNPCMLEVDDFLYQHGIPTSWIVWDVVKNDPGWSQLKGRVVFLNFIFWRSYNQIAVKHVNPVNAQWNPQADRFLFLTGKPNKQQRIWLLYQLHTQGLTSKCNHSLFMSPGMYLESRALLSELSDSEFDAFIQQYRRNPDNITPQMQETSMHYGGIPYDPVLYANSLFRLVSESNIFSDVPLVSEKTYLTIANKNPFVIAGDLHSCKYLTDLGFASFDKLFDIPSYDDMENCHWRLMQVVEHTKQWLAKQFNTTEVADMVEHNYQQFLRLGQQIEQDFVKTTGVDINLAISSKDPQGI